VRLSLTRPSPPPTAEIRGTVALGQDGDHLCGQDGDHL